MKPILLLLALTAVSSAHLADEPVDDRQIKSELLAFGEAQFNEGKAVKAGTLREQLSRRRCQLALQPEAAGNDSLSATARRIRQGVTALAALYKCTKCTKWHVSVASGFFISSDGVLVTNHHVVSSADKEMFIALSGDGRMSVVTEVLAADPVTDVAILRCGGSGYSALSLRADPPPGSPVAVWSHPDGHFFTLSSGIVSRRFLMRKPGGSAEVLAITADYGRGSSGGPVFDERGNAVGMVSSTDSVYFTEERGQQRNLQMVFKNCVSARSILALIEPQPPK